MSETRLKQSFAVVCLLAGSAFGKISAEGLITKHAIDRTP